jgi:signal transduction histidine kinase
MGAKLDLDELLTSILAETTALLRAERATLFLLEGDRLVSRVTSGKLPSAIEIPIGQGIAGRVAETGRLSRVRDAYRSRRFDRSWDAVTGYRTRAMLTVPLRGVGGYIIGVLQVLNKRGARGEAVAFTKHDASLLTALGTQTAVALERARLFRSFVHSRDQLVRTKEQLEHSLRDREFLYELQTAMSRAETLDELARAVLTSTARILPAEAGGMLVEGSSGQLHLYVVSLDRPTDVTRVILRPGEGVASRAMEKAQPLVVQRESIDDPPRVRGLLGFEPGAAVALPLCADSGCACGALVFYHRSPDGPSLSRADDSLTRLVTANVSAQVELFRARTDRERQNRLMSIGRLLSGVMHDLKTPLTVIGGYVELMEAAGDARVRAEHAATVREQFGIIAEMQRDLLAYARGETSLLRRKVLVGVLCRDLARQLDRELAARRIELLLDVDERATAFVDEGKLSRALLNLLHNAIEAMEHKGSVLRLGCREHDAGLVISVADDGPGIPGQIRGRLFEPFVTAGKPRGTGLGLSIVKSTIEEHGGHVEVESSARGTRFTLTIPRSSGPLSRRVQPHAASA